MVHRSRPRPDPPRGPDTPRAQRLRLAQKAHQPGRYLPLACRLGARRGDRRRETPRGAWPGRFAPWRTWIARVQGTRPAGY